MKIHHISQTCSVLNHFLIEIRDKDIQKDRWRFRQNLERIGEILCYEMSKTLNFKDCNIETPLGHYQKSVIDDDIVICSILRAGLTMHQGVSRFFDHLDNAFISAYRTQDNDSKEFKIHIGYFASPDLNGRTLVLIDPMLATGHSLVETYKQIESKYKIKHLHILAAIASEDGIKYLDKNLPDSTQLWVADIDKDLNQKGYIIPGLGDAGDLAFGEKL